MKDSGRLPPLAKPKQDAPSHGPTRAQGPSPSAPWHDDARMRAAIAERAMRPMQAKVPVETGYDHLVAAAQRKPDPTGIPAPVRAKMEGAFGTDFSDVRVHPGSTRAAGMGALAFTQGSEIHVAPGQWAPETTKGQELLGHELSHVLQQRAGRVAVTTQLAGAGLNDDPALEAEADTMGALAARGDARARPEARASRAADAAPVQRACADCDEHEEEEAEQPSTPTEDGPVSSDAAAREPENAPPPRDLLKTALKESDWAKALDVLNAQWMKVMMTMIEELSDANIRALTDAGNVQEGIDNSEVGRGGADRVLAGALAVLLSRPRVKVENHLVRSAQRSISTLPAPQEEEVKEYLGLHKRSPGAVAILTWYSEELENDPHPELQDEEQVTVLAVSEEGFDFLVRHEGKKAKPYNDSQGHCTIGIGHLVHRGRCNGSEPGDYRAGLSEDEIFELFRADLGKFEDLVRNNVTVRLNQAQFDALVSFTFNTGKLPGTNVLTVLNQGFYSKVPAALMQWLSPPEIRGRRSDEARLFRTGEY